MPTLRPRRVSKLAAAMIARQIGRNGPSTAPMTMRLANNVAKFGARPEKTEQTEKITIAPSRNGLRLPAASDHRPMK